MVDLLLDLNKEMQIQLESSGQGIDKMRMTINDDVEDTKWHPKIIGFRL